MKRVILSPEQQVALQLLLQGEFDFYGLISTLPRMDTVLRSWSYTRGTALGRRTVRSSSSEGVPHGYDAQVLRALLFLHQQQAPQGPYPRILTDAAGLQAALAPFGVQGNLGDGDLLRALERLAHTSVMITSRRRNGNKVMTLFSLLDTLEAQVREENGVIHLDRVVCGIGDEVRWLARYGELRPFGATGSERPEG